MQFNQNIWAKRMVDKFAAAMKVRSEFDPNTKWWRTRDDWTRDVPKWDWHYWLGKRWRCWPGTIECDWLYRSDVQHAKEKLEDAFLPKEEPISRDNSGPALGGGRPPARRAGRQVSI